MGAIKIREWIYLPTGARRDSERLTRRTAGTASAHARHGLFLEEKLAESCWTELGAVSSTSTKRDVSECLWLLLVSHEDVYRGNLFELLLVAGGIMGR